MLDNVINEFRKRNYKKPILSWNTIISEFCRYHCWAMINRGELYHTEGCYLEDWAEAIAMSDFFDDWSTTHKILIYDILGSSPEHRNILLNSTEIGYAIVFHKDKVYLTIRGR